MGKYMDTNKRREMDLMESAHDTDPRVRDWLSDPEKYIQEIENAEILLERLLQEREMLLAYIKALRDWARDVAGWEDRKSGQPSDMALLEAMMNLPGYLRKEIQMDYQTEKI